MEHGVRALLVDSGICNEWCCSVVIEVTTCSVDGDITVKELVTRYNELRLTGDLGPAPQ